LHSTPPGWLLHRARAFNAVPLLPWFTHWFATPGSDRPTPFWFVDISRSRTPQHRHTHHTWTPHQHHHCVILHGSTRLVHTRRLPVDADTNTALPLRLPGSSRFGSLRLLPSYATGPFVRFHLVYRFGMVLDKIHVCLVPHTVPHSYFAGHTMPSSHVYPTHHMFTLLYTPIWIYTSPLALTAFIPRFTRHAHAHAFLAHVLHSAPPGLHIPYAFTRVLLVLPRFGSGFAFWVVLTSCVCVLFFVVPRRTARTCITRTPRPVPQVRPHRFAVHVYIYTQPHCTRFGPHQFCTRTSLHTGWTAAVWLDTGWDIPIGCTVHYRITCWVATLPFRGHTPHHVGRYTTRYHVPFLYGSLLDAVLDWLVHLPLHTFALHGWTTPFTRTTTHRSHAHNATFCRHHVPHTGPLHHRLRTQFCTFVSLSRTFGWFFTCLSDFFCSPILAPRFPHISAC